MENTQKKMTMKEFKKTELGKETMTLEEITIIKKQLNNKIKSLSVRNYSDNDNYKSREEIANEINYQIEQLNNFLVDLLDDLRDYLFEEFSKKYYYSVQDPFEKINLISNKFKEILTIHLEE